MNKFIKVLGKLILYFAISFLLIFLVSRSLDWKVVLSILSNVSLFKASIATSIFLVALYIRAIKWRIFFVNHEISTYRLFVVQNIGVGLNNLIPIRILSEPVQIWILAFRDRISTSVILASLIMERITDFIVTIFILIISFIFIYELREFRLYLWFVLGIFILFSLLFLLFYIGNTIRYFSLSQFKIKFAWINKIFHFIVPFISAIRDLQSERKRMMFAVMMSMFYWLLVGIAAWILSVSINMSISPVTAILVMMVTISFVSIVPGAPSGIGTFEFAVVYILKLFGVEEELALVFALIMHVIFFLPSILMSIIFLPREGLGLFEVVKSILGGKRNLNIL